MSGYIDDAREQLSQWANTIDTETFSKQYKSLNHEESPVTNIKGKYITIEEMPFGCVVNDIESGSHVVIGDLEDVDLLISSLQRLKADWYGDSYE